MNSDLRGFPSTVRLGWPCPPAPSAGRIPPLRRVRLVPASESADSLREPSITPIPAPVANGTPVAADSRGPMFAFTMASCLCHRQMLFAMPLHQKDRRDKADQRAEHHVIARRKRRPSYSYQPGDDELREPAEQHDREAA